MAPNDCSGTSVYSASTPENVDVLGWQVLCKCQPRPYCMHCLAAGQVFSPNLEYSKENGF